MKAKAGRVMLCAFRRRFGGGWRRGGGNPARHEAPALDPDGAFYQPEGLDAGGAFVTLEKAAMKKNPPGMLQTRYATSTN